MYEDHYKLALELHRKNRGKIGIHSKVPVKDRDDLSIAYTPGVAQPCLEIHKNPEDIYAYTNKGNFVAVVSDGSAVLGLGNIGGASSLPVMEGKCVLFKEFGGVDAFPICLNTQDPEEIITVVKSISPSFGGVNLEDIKAPECFYIERRLKEEIKIPIFHDDQHGTAIVTLSGLLNAVIILGKRLEELTVVINGAGAAGTAICKLLLSVKIGNILICDRRGIIYPGRKDLNWAKEELARITNVDKKKGSLSDALIGADVFIGVSGPNLLSPDMVKRMGKDPVIFAQANPIPEIDPVKALAAGARIIATGRSDYPNQINNVLAFPGVFRGALDVRASDINEEMKIAAAKALAEAVDINELREDYIIPSPFDLQVGPKVAAAVAVAAIESGVAALKTTYHEEYERALKIISGRNFSEEG